MVKIVFMVSLFASCIVKGQVVPMQVAITTNKTTNLIFPFAVKSVDRGSSSVIVQRAAGAPYILQVKADSVLFASTNLSVVTEDGSFYSFLLSYAADPPDLNIIVGKGYVPEEGSILQSANALLHLPVKSNLCATAAHGIKLAVCGLYARTGVFYFVVRAVNTSSIDYPVALLQLAITDLRRSRRTAVQEQLVTPLARAGSFARIPAHSNTKMVLAVPQFTIPDQKVLLLSLFEDNGGRHVVLRMRNKVISKVRPL